MIFATKIMSMWRESIVSLLEMVIFCLFAFDHLIEMGLGGLCSKVSWLDLHTVDKFIHHLLNCLGTPLSCSENLLELFCRNFFRLMKREVEITLIWAILDFTFVGPLTCKCGPLLIPTAVDVKISQKCMCVPWPRLGIPTKISMAPSSWVPPRLLD